MFSVIDLGRLGYAEALEQQRAHHEAVLAGRGAGAGELGRILTVEHDPVVTVTRRPGVMDHLVATPELLAAHGIEVHETDRGGDITYHGPGQVVVYPIVDLKRVGLRVIEYVRLLEQAVIDAIAGYGLEGVRDEAATGVWVERDGPQGKELAKVCAIGVRVRKWITLHGLAVNVRTDLSHFGLIVPCGLAGRPVARLADVVEGCPSDARVRDAVVGALVGRLDEAVERRAGSPSHQG